MFSCTEKLHDGKKKQTLELCEDLGRDIKFSLPVYAGFLCQISKCREVTGNER